MTASGEIERVDVTVTYDGAALRGHQMDVRDLAPALLGFAEVVQAAHETLRPDQPVPSVNIRATGEGSFVVDLQVIHEEVVNLLTGNDVGALLSVVGLIQSARGVFSYFRNRRRPDSREDQLANGTVRITLPNGTVIEYPPEVVLLAQQLRIRRGTEQVIAPLGRDGIDAMSVTSPQDRTGGVRITSDDLPVLRLSLEDDYRGDLVTDIEFVQRLTVTSPNFQAGNKWRLSDGDAWYWMSMSDLAFRERVDRGEVAFRKNDQLEARVKLQQWRLPTGELHNERAIIEVIRHIQAPVYRATNLFDDTPPSDSDDIDQ